MSALVGDDLAILRGLAAGKTLGRIGAQLEPPVSEDVAKYRARAMYQRLGAANQAQAVALAYERGLLGGSECRGCRCLAGVSFHARAQRVGA